jgi:nucleotide-binding universal stress UspA family protein
MKKFGIQNILVPIDFSPISVRSISAAEYLADHFQGSVHLANICEQFYPAGFSIPSGPVPLPARTYLDSVRQVAAKRLKTLARQRRLTGGCYTQIGAPVFSEICRIAQKIPADLIVTSTHGRTGLKHVLLGSTAERLVQHSPCPVLVARETRTKSRFRKDGVNRILVPVDFSECSLQGLKYAIQFAVTSSAKILVLNAVHFGQAFAANRYHISDFSRLQDAVCKGAVAQMRIMVRRARFGDIEFETKIKVGLPIDVIRTVAQQNDVDLIITATHGRTGLKRVLIGSTAEQVVRHAPCPVLVVPSHPQERAKQLNSRARQPRELPRLKPLLRHGKDSAEAKKARNFTRIAKQKSG